MGILKAIARRDRKRGPMQELSSAEVSATNGVGNDFRGKPGKRQVTVMSADVWGAVCAELGVDLPWTTRRANLLVEGIDLPRQAGGILEIGSARLEVMLETDPCSRMDEQLDGLRAALMPDWRGGVCCRVIAGGDIAVGDEVRLLSVRTA